MTLAVFQGRTREQIAVAIGENLGAIFLSTMTAQGTTTTLVDSTLIGGDDDHNGKWVRFTSGTNDGEIRRVADYVASTTIITIDATGSALTQTESGDTYELWDEEYQPESVHRRIVQAGVDITGMAFDPIENTSLHGDKVNARFDIPADIYMIRAIDYRESVTGKTVHACDRVFNETETLASAANQKADDQDLKRGSASLQLNVQAGATAGQIVTDSITSIDLSGYTHIEGWVKATVALAANDYVLRLDSGVVQGDGTDLEILNVPAASVDTWTRFRVALANPETDTAIISVGIEMSVDKGAHRVWFDDIQAIRLDTERWARLPNHLWRAEQEAADLVLTTDGVNVVGYSLLKILGGDRPVLLSADATTTETHASYIIYRATGLLMKARNKDGAGDWFGLAEMEKRRFGLLQDARIVR
jgi:hypothetical protein